MPDNVFPYSIDFYPNSNYNYNWEIIMNTQRLKIKYLLNCALLMEYKGSKILIDGLFDDRQLFDPYPPAFEENIYSKKDIFSGLSALCFTHCHFDHYDEAKVLKYIDMNQEDTILVPSNHGLPDRILSNGSNIKEMHTPAGLIGNISIGDFEISYLKTGHITYDYPEHYCIQIKAGEGTVLVTGDMHPEYYAKLPAFFNMKNCISFFNAVSIWKYAQAQAIFELPGMKYIYHIPSEEKDQYEYRKITLSLLKKYGDLHPDVHFLTESMTEI